MDITNTTYPPDSVIGALNAIEALQAEKPTGRPAVREHREKLSRAITNYNKLVGWKAFAPSLAAPLEETAVAASPTQSKLFIL